MHTPSLRRRVVWLGVAMVVFVVAAIEVFLFFSMKSSLLSNLDNVLDDRARLVTAEAVGKSPTELAERLTELGIRSTLRGPDGAIHEAQPPSPLFGNNLPASPSQQGPVVTREVALPGGITAVVYARRGGTDAALRKLLVFEGLGLAIATAMAAVLLRRTTTMALEPLRKIAESARRTSSGQRGVRLDPDEPDTHLGQLATAHDDMVAALEQAIQDAHEAQARSERLRERERQVIQTATAAFVSVDAGGRITDWNAAAERTFGWTAEEAVGAVLTDTAFPLELGAGPFADLHRLVDSALGRGVEMPVKALARHRDGRVIPVEVTMWATTDGEDQVFSAFIQDITERARGEEASSRLAAIVDSAQEAIFGTSLDGTVLTWNRGARLLYGFTAAEIVGQPDSILVPADRVGEATAFSDQVAKGEPVSRQETVRRCKNGTEVEVAITMSPIRSQDGTVVGASTIARDISEQRWMAGTLDSMIGALQAALDEAKASEELSRRFLADAAHQLRTPVAGIRACAETLLRGTTAEQRDRLLADMVRETARASRLVGSLLQLARLDQGQPLSPQPSDILALCESEAERARTLAPDLAIRVDSLDPLPHSLEFDRHALREILANLLDNARRHAATRVDVMVRETGGHLEIGVTDDGPGVPPGLTDRIFERFVSLDGRGGSGLGLPIARGLARAHGGDLVYRGKVFVLSLPVGAHLELEPAEHTAR